MATFNNAGKTAKPRDPMYQQGKQLFTVQTEYDVVGANVAAGDILVLAESLSLDARVHRVLSPEATPALAGATDVDFGFYRKDNDGNLVEIDKDIVIDGANIAAGVAQGDLLRLNASLDRTLSIGGLLGLGSDSAYNGGIVFAATFNSEITGDGTLDLDIQIEPATTL